MISTSITKTLVNSATPRLQCRDTDWYHGFGTPYAVYLLYLDQDYVHCHAGAAIISLNSDWAG